MLQCRIANQAFLKPVTTNGLRNCVYPNGDKERNGERHISLYLVIAETGKLPLGWEVNVRFTLFEYDHIQDKYMTFQDANGKVRCFHGMRTELGFAQLLPLTLCNDSANGYLIHDMCVFGAEVFVINYTGRGECLTVLKGLVTTCTWKIVKFSSLDDKVHYSDVFTIENLKCCKMLLCFNLRLVICSESSHASNATNDILRFSLTCPHAPSLSSARHPLPPSTSHMLHVFASRMTPSCVCKPLKLSLPRASLARAAYASRAFAFGSYHLHTPLPSAPAGSAPF
ncbi:hypothetical protein TEA_005203 [Camellia sinensis var. sinensis]|uniref:MATH domain-containing protein n=1 Tax=Camellia sinensis var. sinensis TaxID=542762 RepID=A0A4S4EUH3_CAMSN|nr:hypothetical protein TEA_005203 [Camellia sinensis var. sinensis]